MAVIAEVELLKRRRTKIVATLGPATSTSRRIDDLIEAGVNVFRLNMSHGDHDRHRQTIELVRDAVRRAARSIAILADLAGPKIRTGTFEGGSIDLEQNERVTVTTRAVPGRPGLIPSVYAALAQDVSPGARILLADGTLELEVQDVAGSEVHCVVKHGGKLSDRQGINLPNVEVSAPCLTEKDIADAAFLLEHDVDFLGLSFVRRRSDVEALRTLIAEANREVGIVAKIERPEALLESDAIIDAADAIMVARGDLGVELAPEQVPIVQRQLVDQGRLHGKPVIVATQMLDSMIESSRPTRAEVADVSGSVLSGADAIMLSGETAVGAHPIRAVQMMDRIARQSEGYCFSENAFGDFGSQHFGEPPIPMGDAVARSTAQLSRDLRVRAIFAISRSGMSAATMSSARPAAPVVAISDRQSACRKMALMWGVVPHLVDDSAFAEPIALTRALTADLDLGAKRDWILLVRGFHSDRLQNTPSITLINL